MTLGINNTILMNDSFVEAVKITQAPVIERLDIFYLTFGLTSLFSGLIIVFSAVVEFACKIFSKVKRIFVVFGVFVVFFALSMPALNVKNLIKIYDSFDFYLVLISCVLIPLFVFILAKIKKRTKKRSRKGDV